MSSQHVSELVANCGAGGADRSFNAAITQALTGLTAYPLDPVYTSPLILPGLINRGALEPTGTQTSFLNKPFGDVSLQLPEMLGMH